MPASLNMYQSVYFSFAAVLLRIVRLILVFPLSDETYFGGHISLSTNASALQKQFSILEVSDCERHIKVRHEVSLSPVTWRDIQPIKPLPCVADVLWGQASAFCWSKVTQELCWATALDNSCLTTNRSGGTFEALLPHPFCMTIWLV